MMKERARLCTAGAIVLGGLIGWLAGSGRMPGHLIAADSPSASSSPTQFPVVNTRCDTGAGRAVLLASSTPRDPASAQERDSVKKPNILVIMGDDIGIWNLSTYHQGMMGYRTPNIDRLAQEGGKFVTYYAQQSCTAGRSAFITGQLPFRTGLSKVGLAGCRPRNPQGGSDHRRVAQAARVLDWPVRQEPSRRQGRIPAHEPRVRRVLRQPLPPQCRGRTGERGLPEKPRLPEEVRSARGDQSHAPTARSRIPAR